MADPDSLDVLRAAYRRAQSEPPGQPDRAPATRWADVLDLARQMVLERREREGRERPGPDGERR